MNNKSNGKPAAKNAQKTAAERKVVHVVPERDHLSASTLCLESVKLRAAIGDRWGMIESFEALTEIRAIREEPERAARAWSGVSAGLVRTLNFCDVWPCGYFRHPAENETSRFDGVVATVHSMRKTPYGKVGSSCRCDDDCNQISTYG